MSDKCHWLKELYEKMHNLFVFINTISFVYTSSEKYGSAVCSSSYISSCDSVDSGGVQVVDGVGVAR